MGREWPQQSMVIDSLASWDVARQPVEARRRSRLSHGF